MHPAELIMGAAPLPDPDVIRRTAEEGVARPDYQLEAVRASGPTLLDVLLRVLWWLLGPIRALFGVLSDISPVLAWLVIIALVLVLVALVAHIAYTFKVALERRRTSRRFEAGSGLESIDPATLERQAEEEVAGRNYIAAVRLLFRACLLRLHQTEKRTFRMGLTNREHLHRYRSTRVFDALKLFVGTIDAKWYGGGVCLAEDYEACRGAHDRIRGTIKERTHAHSP